MPRGDRTGPMGAGSMTGWGRGWCRGVDSPGSGRGFYGWSHGFGLSRGGGGWRHQHWAPRAPGWARGDWGPGPLTEIEPPAETEQQWLEQRVESLEDELGQIKSRLHELAPDTSEAE